MTGRAAVDVDECRDVTGTCGVGAESCVNDVGGYECTCRDGYEFKDGTCTGITRSSSLSHSLSLCHYGYAGINSFISVSSNMRTRGNRRKLTKSHVATIHDANLFHHRVVNYWNYSGAARGHPSTLHRPQQLSQPALSLRLATGWLTP